MKTINVILQKIAIVILAVLILQSCKKSHSPAPQSISPLITEQGTPAGDISNGSIGASGGSLQSTDGNLTVSIPSGALSSNISISIQPISNKAPLSLGFGYRLLPEGTTFNKPIQLTFHYTDQLLKASLPDFLWIVTQASDGSWNAMLKSAVDKSAKTVTVQTTHFSDWALGRFIDFTLNPAASIIQKGQSVILSISGFSRDKAISDDELAPLIPITGDGFDLAPLTPIPPTESRLMDFKVTKWTMNGVTAPVSNSNGSLNPSDKTATYTAPNKMPTTNPVAVTVQLEANNKEGGKASYMVTSNISVIESDLYVLLTIDGKKYEYFQYGVNGIAPPDPTNFSSIVCGTSDGRFGFNASILSTTAGAKNIFQFVFDNPSETTRNLVGFNKNGHDEMEFIPSPGVDFNINYTRRTPNASQSCDLQSLCSGISTTMFTYSAGSNVIISGYFSGKIYEDKPEYSNNCQTPDSHTIEGEFRLMQIN